MLTKFNPIYLRKGILSESKLVWLSFNGSTSQPAQPYPVLKNMYTRTSVFSKFRTQTILNSPTKCSYIWHTLKDIREEQLLWKKNLLYFHVVSVILAPIKSRHFIAYIFVTILVVYTSTFQTINGMQWSTTQTNLTHKIPTFCLFFSGKLNQLQLNY